MSTKTRFEKEAKGNSEMVYCNLWTCCILFLDDYLGQVIVPLSTVNRDQTCRLILPILPKSSKSEHSKGEISLEVRQAYIMKKSLQVIFHF